MAQQLSGVTVVIFIAGGILTFILLFIFAKRQIMRFALRSRRGPHVPIGHDGKKVKINSTNISTLNSLKNYTTQLCFIQNINLK